MVSAGYQLCQTAGKNRKKKMPARHAPPKRKRRGCPRRLIDLAEALI